MFKIIPKKNNTAAEISCDLKNLKLNELKKIKKTLNLPNKKPSKVINIKGVNPKKIVNISN